MPFDIPISSCPYCHTRIESATDGINVQRKPREGDLLICLNCAGFLKLDAQLLPVVLPESEFMLLSAPYQLDLLQARQNVRSRVLRDALKRAGKPQ